MKNPKLSFLSILALVIAVSLGFYLGLSDERTAAIDPNFSSEVPSAEYTGDLIGAWSFGANVLRPRFSGVGISYVRNDTGWLYLMGGDTNGLGGNTIRNDRYNLRTNSWQIMAPMLSGVQYMGRARLRDSMYTVGGMGTSYFSSAMNNLRKYSIIQDSWVERAPLPQVLGWPECVEYQDSIIYAIGGCINGGSGAGSQVYVYNALNNTWRTGTPLPVPKEGGALGIKGDTLVYVGGAPDYFQIPTFTTYRGLISQSNRANIAWSTALDKPGSTRWRFDFNDWGCKGLILDMGYSTGFGTSTEVYVYSPGANTWTAQPNALTATSTSQSGSFALSNNIFKLICASGLRMSNPYTIPQTQIFTDTICIVFYPQTSVCRSSINKPILDHVLTYDTINVGLGNACVVRDLNVRIDNVTHTFDSDLRFYIRKGSTAMRIINRVGGSGDNFIGTVLNDSAATNINSGFAPFTGQYSPSAPAQLSAFNNQPTDGGWILTITDTVSGSTGMLSAWCLVISYQCPVGGIKTVEIPNYYELKQNYPNPFNPSTTIEYALPNVGDVKLVVYDLLGKEVATLVNEFKQAGIYNVHFDASNLASGVYFYRIQTKDFTQTKKMLTIK